MSVAEVRARFEPVLLSIPGVVGVAADVARGTIIVYVESEEAAERVPRELEGFPVEVRVVGRIAPLG